MTKKEVNIRTEFPILQRKVNGQPLVYLDNAASTHKPKAVLDSIQQLYTQYYSNIHRGVHTLSRESTEAFELARKKIAAFIGATEKEIVFTAGTTDSINLVASGLSIPQGSEILLSTLEHHSNILPWQLWCERNKGQLKVIPLKEDGHLDLDKLGTLISSKTALLAITHVSNTLGTINNVKEIISKVKSIQPNIQVLVDGAQSVAHLPVNVKELDCDYFVFSGHKMYAPTGAGVLYMKEEKASQLQLSRTGGGTIREVSFERTEYVEAPLKFEPGTPNIEGVIGLAAATDLLMSLDMRKISQLEHRLFSQTYAHLKSMPEIQLYSPERSNGGIISFNVKGAHPFDTGTLLDKYGIAVRTGHHCTQPLMQHFGIPGTVRVSFAMYNTPEDCERFITALHKTIKMLS